MAKQKKTVYEKSQEYNIGEGLEKDRKWLDNIYKEKCKGGYHSTEMIELNPKEFFHLYALAGKYMNMYEKRKYLISEEEFGSIYHALNTAAKTVIKQTEIMEGMLRWQNDNKPE